MDGTAWSDTKQSRTALWREFELTGKDTAEAKTYFVVMTDIGPDHAGNYTDELVKKGDRWVFKYRRVDLVWRHPDSCFPPVKRKS